MTTERPVDRGMLKFRSDFMLSLRKLFDSEGFVEIETPYLIPANTPDPYIDPITAALKHPFPQTMQLRTSPELWLKKALSLGFRNIYELARVFRDDPPGRAHHREFTMLEWYRKDADLDDLIKDCDDLFKLAAKKAHEHFGLSLSAPPLVKKSLPDLFLEKAGIDLDHVLDQIRAGSPNYLKNLLVNQGELIPEDSSFMDAFFHIMLKYVEPSLNKDEATVITRWPVQLAALAAPSPDDTRYCGRFEIYYQGLEIANAYQECTDKEILTARFKEENLMRKKLQKPEFPIDNAFLEALSTMPESAGIALGIDRLLQSTLKITHLGDLIWGFSEQKF